jgi:hypothetical protein
MATETLSYSQPRRQARQCGARTKSGKPCRSPATKRGAAGCTAPQTVVTALLVSAGNTVTASGTKAAIAERQKFSALLKMLRAGLM